VKWHVFGFHACPHSLLFLFIMFSPNTIMIMLRLCRTLRKSLKFTCTSAEIAQKTVNVLRILGSPKTCHDGKRLLVIINPHSGRGKYATNPCAHLSQTAYQCLCCFVTYVKSHPYCVHHNYTVASSFGPGKSSKEQDVRNRMLQIRNSLMKRHWMCAEQGKITTRWWSQCSMLLALKWRAT